MTSLADYQKDCCKEEGMEDRVAGLRARWIPAAAALWVILGLAFALNVHAQANVHRIGFLGSGSASAYAASTAAFRAQLKSLGWIEGKTFTIDYRWAENELEKLPQLAASLAASGIDLFVAQGTPAAIAAKNAKPVRPVVFVQVGDPLGSGLVESMARPGGHVTGFTILELDAKRLELIKEIIPSALRVGILMDPAFPLHVASYKELTVVAKGLGMELRALEFRTPADFETNLERAAKPAIPLVIMGHSMAFTHAALLARLTRKLRIPTVALYSEFAEAGGLMAYGPSIPDQYRQAATYVDKILKGAKPAQLPVQQPTKFELTINLQAARSLGVAIPPALLVRADKVIQ